MTDKPLLGISEAAEVAGLSPSVAYRMAREGQLPGLVRLPNHRMVVRRRVLEAWLAGEEDAAADPVPAALRALR